MVRRAFLGGVGRAARVCLGTATFGSVLSGAVCLCACSGSDGDKLDVLEVAESDVITLDAFSSYKDADAYVTVEELASFAAGTLFSGTGSTLAAALSPGLTADPLSTLGLLDLSTSVLTEVFSAPLGNDEGYSFYAATASDELLVWVESNFLDSSWRIYAASIESASAVGEPRLLDFASNDYDAPEICAIGSSAYWIVQPSTDGAKSKEDSLLKVSSGGGEASVLFTSPGRFNGGLSVSGTVVTAMPRVETSGVYYQLVAIENGTGATLATQVLPRSFKPSCAIYMGGAFSFSIGASYSYGGGIANVGTYYPLGDGTWLRIAKIPLTPPGLIGDWLFCKSGARTVFVDVVNRGYLTVNAPDAATDYGDYPVAVGERDALYTYASMESVDGQQSDRVVLRRLTLK